MTGAEVPKDLLNSDAQGATTTFITAVAGSYSWVRMGTTEGMFCVQVVTVELTQPYCACLSPSMMRIPVNQEKKVVMPMMKINDPVVVGRMHQAVTTTACAV
jgi:hypothetical protein